MADTGLFNSIYTPDVLSCLANLSNDEVFTPPDVANAMLDLLPQELFRNPDTTFLDPACKSGVFLREIAKRLIVGLEPQFPDLQDRLDHIFHKQLFGIAITELTSLLSRRSLYCSKYPNSEYSVSHFDDPQGNVRFKRINHVWRDGKCKYCGASASQYQREDELETHAYEWIHTMRPEELFGMKFDVIISNPPYQLDTGGSGRQAKPIYNLFVEQAKKLKPRYLSMIIPSRWFAGGMGLDAFRKAMIEDSHITSMTDYVNAKDCFPQNSISGGVCYFLWERDRSDLCSFTSVSGNSRNTLIRNLNEFDVLVRYNAAVNIIHKIAQIREPNFSEYISSISPFGLQTKVRGVKHADAENQIALHSSDGISYISETQVKTNNPYYDCYKVLISQTSAEHAGEPGKDGRFRVLTSTMKVLEPKEVCTHSYLLAGPIENKKIATNMLSYLKTRFVRFLMLQAISSIHLTRSTFEFVPIQDFSKPWTDEELYAKYGLTQEEIDFIESMIKPME